MKLKMLLKLWTISMYLPLLNISSASYAEPAPPGEGSYSEQWPSNPVNPGRYGNSVYVNALLWRGKVNEILSSKLGDSKQVDSHLFCYFFVRENGAIIGPVTFSRVLKMEQSKGMVKKIMAASPLPPIPGKKRRKISLEITTAGNSYVDFVN